MAIAAVGESASKYHGKHYAIRSRLYVGLRDGSIKPSSFVQDERLKMTLPQACCYCGSRDHLTIDHLLPKKRGGEDSSDNLVWACRSCNSSKCGTDVLTWHAAQKRFPPLLMLRRYLKLAIVYCLEAGVMEMMLGEAEELPFALTSIPWTFPTPGNLQLWVPIRT